MPEKTEEQLLTELNSLLQEYKQLKLRSDIRREEQGDEQFRLEKERELLKELNSLPAQMNKTLPNKSHQTFFTWAILLSLLAFGSGLAFYIIIK
jgi:hypothetical protein